MYRSIPKDELERMKKLAESMTGTNNPWEDEAADAIRDLLKEVAYLKYLIEGHTGYGKPEDWAGYDFGSD